MTDFVAKGELAPIPDDLTIPQFFLDAPAHPLRPERPANSPLFIEDATGRAISFAEAKQKTQDLANGLKIKYNIQDGETICLFSPNHVDYAPVIWAGHRLGAILSPCNPGYTMDELLHQLTTAKARLIITFSGFLKTALQAAKAAGLPDKAIVLLDGTSKDRVSVTELVALGSKSPVSFKEPRLKPGEAKTKIAFLSFSSGTTGEFLLFLSISCYSSSLHSGRAKAVKIPHIAPIANTIQMSSAFRGKRIQAGDVSALALPLFHIYGLVVTLHFMLFRGASLVVIPKFSFEDYLKSLIRHKITHLFLVPPQVVLLTKHPITTKYDLKHVKFVMSGAAPLSGDLVSQLRKVLPNADIGQGYGLTESSTTISFWPESQRIGTVGSAGQLVPGMTARVLKPDGSLGKEGEQGELLVKGPALALGYLDNEQATQETFRDGWLHTGDEVIFRNDDLFIVDRLKELIKVKGFQVAPAELEGHLLAHPAVADACVVGIPDEYSGEVPLAFVVIHADYAHQAKNAKDIEKLKQVILKHVADHKVSYKRLAGGVEFVEIIPKNPSGKILRRILRDQAKAARANSKPSTFVRSRL